MSPKKSPRTALHDWKPSVWHGDVPRCIEARSLSLGGKVTLRLRADREAPIERVCLRTCPDGEEAWSEMEADGEDAASRWWQARVRVANPSFGYRFYLHTPEGAWYFNARGLTRITPLDAFDFRLLVDAGMPSWVPDAFFYQVFPERFARGTSRPAPHPLAQVLRQWGDRPRPHTRGGGYEHFGGDLWGLAEHLDHVQELGANALYLNPIFAAPSNHKYDVADYHRVDESFGGDEALLSLRRALDERGLRCILDVTPNHCGITNEWFVRARDDEQAPTRDFFRFYGPDQYECWLGVRSLAKLDYRSPGLREAMYEGHDAVLRRWLRSPWRADGWRLDVANMVGRCGADQLGHEVGRGIRRAVKAEFPDAYLLGEHFHDGTPHLQGDEIDASMNYRGFMFPVYEWLAGADIPQAFKRGWAPARALPSDVLLEQWQEYLAAIPWAVARQQFNLLGSHDTPRVLTVLHEDLRLLRIALTLLFTFPGVPSVYYGDEVGLLGGRDPDNRRCMPWDPSAWNAAVWQEYRDLARMRREHEALRRGAWQSLVGQDDTLAFSRETASERCLVVACRGTSAPPAIPVRAAALADGTVLTEARTGATSTVCRGFLDVPGLASAGAQVWTTHL